jgi:hypothetical protein
VKRLNTTIALAALILLAAAIAARAFQPPCLTLTNPSDYGNLIVSLQEAQGGVASQAIIGTRELGVVTINIPAR